MRIQNFFTILIFSLAIALTGVCVTGMYKVYRTNEDRRVEELSNNMHHNLTHSLRNLVAQIDASFDWKSEGEPQHSDAQLLSMFEHLGIRDIHRLDEPDVFLWPIEQDSPITKMTVQMGKRSYQVAYVKRDDALMPMLRVDPVFNNSEDVRALYFYPSAVMDFDLVHDASIIAYDLESSLFGAIYPASLYGSKSSYVMSQVDLVRHHLPEKGLNDGVMRIDDFKFIHIPLSGSSGFVIGRDAASWHGMAWLPESSSWWAMLAATILIPSLLVMIAVRRYVSLPIKLATQAMRFDSHSFSFVPKKVADPLIPGESRTLLQEARRLVISKQKEKEDEVISPVAKVLSEPRFSTRMQQAMMTDSVRHRGAMLLVLEGNQGNHHSMSEDTFKQYLESVGDAINSFYHLDHFSPLGVSSILSGFSARYGFWIWVESDAHLSVVADEFLAHITKIAQVAHSQGGVPYQLHVLDHDQGISSSSEVMEALTFSARRQERGQKGEKIHHLTPSVLQYWAQDRAMSLAAKQGFSDEDISLRVTPVVRNGTGEVGYLRVQPFAVFGELKEFPVQQGEWMMIDHHGTFVHHLVLRSIRLLRRIEHWGFDNVKVALPIDIGCASHEAFWLALDQLSESSRSRLVIELGGPVMTDVGHYVLRNLHERGVGVAFYHQPENSLLGVIDKAEYLMADAAMYQSHPTLFHSVQVAIRRHARLVSNLDGAGPYFLTSSFCMPNDFSVMYSHQHLNKADALRFIQRDIAKNVLSAVCDSEEDGEREGSGLQDAGSKRSNVVQLKAGASDVYS